MLVLRFLLFGLKVSKHIPKLAIQKASLALRLSISSPRSAMVLLCFITSTWVAVLEPASSSLEAISSMSLYLDLNSGYTSLLGKPARQIHDLAPVFFCLSPAI